MNANDAKTISKATPALLKTTVCEKIGLPANKAIFVKKIIAVAVISPTITGLTPLRAPWTNLFFKNLDRTIATKMIIINEGKTTPMVEQTAPKIPAVCEPTNVEILIELFIKVCEIIFFLLTDIIL